MRKMGPGPGWAGLGCFEAFPPGRTDCGTLADGVAPEGLVGRLYSMNFLLASLNKIPFFVIFEHSW